MFRRKNKVKDEPKKFVSCWEASWAIQYVVERSLAQRMKQSGWNKKTLFQFYINEHMNGHWKLGHIDEEMLVVPAPTVGEIVEMFLPGEIQMISEKDGFIFTDRQGRSIKRYRIVDAAAEFWMLTKGKTPHA